MEKIRFIEELAMNAWPAEVVEPLDGWRIRWHRTPSRRVNSVWPNEWGGRLPLEVKLQRVEEFYLLRGQTICYQMCPAATPEGLDEVLEARGYVKKSETAVQVAEVDEMLARATLSHAKGGENEMIISETLTDVWLEAYCLVQDASLKQLSLRREALSRVHQPVVYVLVQLKGEPAAVGRGVLDRGWLGVFGMATGGLYRRKGHATGILHEIARWAHAHSVQQMYLQVMENNPAAKSLYKKLGFETLYHYHYREKPINA